MDLVKNTSYIFNPANPGYGASHNVALRNALKINNRYHLVLNADVYFSAGTLEALIDYINNKISIGLVTLRHSSLMVTFNAYVNWCQPRLI